MLSMNESKDLYQKVGYGNWYQYIKILLYISYIPCEAIYIFQLHITLGDHNGANETFITGYVIVLVIEKG